MAAQVEMRPPIFLEKWVKAVFDLNERERRAEERRHRDVGYFLEIARYLTGNYTDRTHDKVGTVAWVKTLPIKIAVGVQNYEMTVRYCGAQYGSYEEGYLQVNEEGYDQGPKGILFVARRRPSPSHKGNDIYNASNFFGGVATPVDIELACQMLEEMNESFALSQRKFRTETPQIAS